MVRLDKTFPTNDCAMCTIGPRLVGVGRHLNIEMITGADVEKVSGEPGNYTVTIKKKNRWVDTSVCKGCGDCTKKLPVQTDSLFQQLLSKENAVYRMFPQAVPGAFAVHKEGTSPCRIACPAGVNPHAYVKLLARARCRKPLMSSTRLCPLPESAAGSAIIPAKQNAIEASSWGSLSRSVR